MKISKTKIDGVLIIEPKVFGDHRGWFTESYSKQKFEANGLSIDFVQDNHSLSVQKGTLRGLHFQTTPKAQTKLVRCTRGEILDVAVDLRKGSPTYKSWISVELSEGNKKQILIPKGFAHGFLALTDNVEVQYKSDDYYAPECDRNILFSDSDIGIDWGIEEPILSKRDLSAPLLSESDADFSVKVLVTGADGQLGHDVVKKLQDMKIDALGTDIGDFDITDAKSTEDFILKEKPDVIIHCAAYTAVDRAEDEKELCYSVNADGTGNIARAAGKVGAKLVYISTDYVFEGKGTEAHSESENTNPTNYYGYTKEQGEILVKEFVEEYFIVRTSWVYGLNGNNFVKTMIKLAETKNCINVVNDQIGAPTYTRDLAEFIVRLIQTKKYGIYHGVNEGYCSWYEFAVAIFEELGIELKVNPIPSEEYPTKAKRPLNSRLSTSNIESAQLDKFPQWRDALSRFIKELNRQEK